MKQIDLYTRMQESLERGYTGYDLFDMNEDLQPLAKTARGWEMDQDSIRQWLKSSEGKRQRKVAESFLSIAKDVVAEVEKAFGRSLPGTLLYLPSFGEFDGFARYDRGEHNVLLGIDFPDADVDYLRALTAHELSHVFRDHSPEVWSHLGKPLSKVSRREYLNAGTAQEHLVSEGLATLFSQALFPEIPASVHHYYTEAEWEWCIRNDSRIDTAFLQCLRTDEDVWSFYSPAKIGHGSPSRTQYYWAAKKLSERFQRTPNPSWIPHLVALHQKPASAFSEFHLKGKAID